jgi:hypothetical protein
MVVDTFRSDETGGIGGLRVELRIVTEDRVQHWNPFVAREWSANHATVLQVRGTWIVDGVLGGVHRLDIGEIALVPGVVRHGACAGSGGVDRVSVVRNEEERFVASVVELGNANRAAKGRAIVVRSSTGLLGIGGTLSAGGHLLLVGKAREVRRRVPSVLPVLVEYRSVKRIGSGPCGHVDGSSRRMAVRGVETGGFELEFTHRVQRRHVSGAALRAGDRRSVDGVLVLPDIAGGVEGGRGTHVKGALLSAGRSGPLHTSGKTRQEERVHRIDGKLLDLATAHRAASGGGLGFQQLRLAGDFHGLGQLAQFEPEFDGDAGPNVQFQAGAHRLFEPRGFHRDGVNPRVQHGRFKEARAVGSGVALNVGLRCSSPLLARRRRPLAAGRVPIP